MQIKEFILEELQKNYDINTDLDWEELNFVEEGYITSLGLIQFVVELEEQFNIRFTDEEIMSKEFQIVGRLVKLVEKKLESK